MRSVGWVEPSEDPPTKRAARAFFPALGAILLAAAACAEPASTFSEAERAAILAHGPWPPPIGPDPSNRVSGKPEAIALGRRLFFDKRLSNDGRRSCATCHDPAKAFADGRARSMGAVQVDRNAIALANLRLNRWFGWDGAGDSLWAQSIRPILDPKELGLAPEELRKRLSGDAALASAYARVLGSAAANDAPELVLVNVAKALAAFQETIVTGRTRFDDFRDALERGDTAAMGRYPLAAQRGLRTFVGKGQCSACHFGANFTSGEFEDVGVPHFAEKGRVDTGRHGGIAALRASPFNLLGRYNDNPVKAPGLATRHVEPCTATGASSACRPYATPPAPRPTCTTAASPPSPTSCATTPRSTRSACTASPARPWFGRSGSHRRSRPTWSRSWRRWCQTLRVRRGQTLRV
jgi:cytochrome c peroxidase